MEVDVIYGHVKGGWEEEPRLKCVSCYFFFFCFSKTQVIDRNIRVTCEVIQRDKILYIYVYIFFRSN